jgi:hypothetical protein
MVRLERTSAFRVSEGNHPQKLVTNATAMAAIIMNALLVSSVIAFMMPPWPNQYLSIIDK